MNDSILAAGSWGVWNLLSGFKCERERPAGVVSPLEVPHEVMPLKEQSFEPAGHNFLAWQANTYHRNSP